MEDVCGDSGRGDHTEGSRGALDKGSRHTMKDRDEGDNERLPYTEARLRVCPRGREMEIQGQLVPEQEVQEPESEEMLSGRKSKRKK